MPSMTRPSTWTIIKTAGGGLVLAFVAAPEVASDVAAYSLLTAGAAGPVLAGYAATDWLLEFPHQWKWIKPLHLALYKPLGIAEDVKPRTYIKIHRNYHKREAIGKIFLPAEFTGVDTTTPTHVIKAKLALTDVSVSYRLAGRKPHLIIKQTPRPPGKCLFEDYREMATAARESAPLIGVGPQGRQVSVDLDAESPHILVNASTGGGKSVITQTITAQMLHHGSQAVFLDFKRHSHKWAQNLPQVEYCKTIGDIHQALVALGEEGHRRNAIVDDWEGDDRVAPVGPRTVIVLEESNATIKKLKAYWAKVRSPKLDPKESPALAALGEILFMGRAVKMHVLLVAQSATVAALGGPEVRECFSTRIMARYTVNAWKMLVPEVSPVPRSTRHVGRAQVVLGGVATETQVLYYTRQEATRWALSGTVAPPPDLMSRDTEAAFSLVEEVPDVSHDVTPTLTLVKNEGSAEPDEERMTLAEACRRGIIPMKENTLIKAKSRDPHFPPGVGRRWTAGELKRWYAGRSA